MKDALRWVAIAALFAIPFLPLYVSGDLFFPFITGKNFAFRFLVEVALAAYVALALIDRRYRPRFSWLLAAFGFLVAWMAVADTYGVYPLKAFWSNYERMDGWVTLVHLFALFVVSSAILSVENLWRRWWFFYVAVAAAVCGYGLLQLAGAAEIHQGGVRLTATLGNAIYLAVYLMFGIFAAAWLSVSARGGTRYALFAFMALAFAVLFFTGSRGPLVGLGVGAVAGALLWLFLERGQWLKGRITRTHLLAGGALVAVALAALAIFVVRDTEYVQDHPILSRAASIFSLEEELRVRGTIWGMALKGIAEDPVTGWGQEGFNQVFNKYYEPSLYAQEQWFDRVHNMYLDWTIAGGVPAGLLFVTLLALAMLAILRAPELSRSERVLLVSALIAYAVQALVVFDNLFSYVPLVLLIALAHARHARAVPLLEQRPEVIGESAQKVIGTGALAAGLVVAWVVNVPGIAAAYHLARAVVPRQDLSQNTELFQAALHSGTFAVQEVREQLSLFATQNVGNLKFQEEDRQELAVLAVEEMKKQIDTTPNDARLRARYAASLETVSDATGALRELDTALALSPRKQVLLLSKGLALHEAGRDQEARDTFRLAYELDPSFDQLAQSVAAGLLLSGDIAGGKALLLEAIGTTTPSNNSLFFAYYQTRQWDDLIGVARAIVVAENGSPQARFRLAQALAAAGRFAEARIEIDATIAAHPDARAAGEALKAQIFVPAR